MKGRNVFTVAEIDRLRRLFREKDDADRDEQKTIRDKMRRIGFYITDFAGNMNSTDFDILLNSGKIEILDYEAFINSKNVSREVFNENKNTIEEDTGISQEDEKVIESDNIFKEGLEPWIDEYSEILILGSLPSDISIKEQAYYQNKSRNSFWKLMHGLFGEGPDSKEFLLKNHIALWDCLAAGNREGNLDSSFSGGEVSNKIPELLASHPSIKGIVLNGSGKPKNFFEIYFKKLYQQIDVIAVPSSSNARGILFEDKRRAWEYALKSLLSH